MPLTVHAAGRTHVGLVRRRNEDSFYAGRSLFAVADGLGGHVAGNVASVTVIDCLRPLDRPLTEADLPAVLGRAIHEANAALRQRIEADPTLASMATTLVAMLCAGTTAVVANVGDSRAYVLRPTGGTSTLTQITEDHTYGHLVADAPDVPHLPERLARFLDGRADGRSPDLTTRGLHAGDRYLLCSDGLSSVVPEEQIRATLNEPSSPETVADRLITLATEHGGPDNITVIVIDVR